MQFIGKDANLRVGRTHVSEQELPSAVRQRFAGLRRYSSFCPTRLLQVDCPTLLITVRQIGRRYRVGDDIYTTV